MPQYSNPLQFRKRSVGTDPVAIERSEWNAMCDNLAALGGEEATNMLQGSINNIFDSSWADNYGVCGGFDSPAWNSIGRSTFMHVFKITNHLYYLETSLVKLITHVPTQPSEALCYLPKEMLPDKELRFILSDRDGFEHIFSFSDEGVQVAAGISNPFSLFYVGIIWGGVN